MSCNGCRVLRKGCSDSCALRPCLQWIEGAEAQGHATVFVAKFFGRAGLMGFIAAVPENQRPALFRSLLYEACGRTVNPVYGAVGLLWSGNWHICQAAVETVLRGGSLKPPAGVSAASIPCYGPMPNLPRLHVKSDQPEDPKRFKTFESHRSSDTNAATTGGGLVNLPSQQEDTKPQVFNRGYPQPLAGQNRTVPVAVKREREEASEIIAPVARRPNFGGGGCQLEPIAAVEDCTIDLDLTLSSHPSTPQLFLTPRKMEPVSETDKPEGATPVPPRMASPSNSFSSEGSVTSLDTGEFIASRNNVACGMDLLQRMENRHHRHHHLQKL